MGFQTTSNFSVSFNISHKFSFEGSRLRGDNFECPVETSYGQEHGKFNVILP